MLIPITGFVALTVLAVRLPMMLLAMVTAVNVSVNTVETTGHGRQDVLMSSNMVTRIFQKIKHSGPMVGWLNPLLSTFGS